MLKAIAFPTTKPLPPPPELGDLTPEERNAWEWMTSGKASFDAQLVNLTPTLARMVRGARKFLRPISRADLRSFILRHRPAIQTSYRALWQEGRVPNVTHSEVVAVLARASYACTREELLSAAAFLATGKQTTDRLEPLLVLREWLLKAARVDLRQRYGKAERAFEMFLNGSRLGSRRLTEAREELFPLPEEREVTAIATADGHSV
jgi:hypothetical protein